ncbi:MAG: ATP-binding protein [Chitinophagales bacterium]|nr:ATP-binding protein [Chitinophagales bacterium]
MQEESTVKDSIFRIGRVISVDGRSIRVTVDKSKNSSHLLYKGDLIKNVSVGSYIKIIKGFTIIIGKVEGEYTIEDKVYSTKEYSSDKEKISRSLNISLLGFFSGKEFERGIKEMPLIDNECYLLDRDEFNKVHDFIRKDDEPLSIGTLTLEKGQEILVGIDCMFASHIGIFGNTGSGKSYTLAKLYRELFKKYGDNPNFIKNAKFFLIDFNGEYVDEDDNVIIDKEYKNIYKLSTKGNGDKYPVSSEALYEPSFWSVILEATEKTQTPFIRRALSNSFLAEKLNDNASMLELIKSKLILALDKNDKELGSKVIIDFLSDIENSLPNSNVSLVRDRLRENLQYYNQGNEFVYIEPESGNWKWKADMRSYVSNDLNAIDISLVSLNSLDKLRLQIVIQYYDDIIKGHANREHLSPLIKRMEKRFEDIRKVIDINDSVSLSKNITVVSLKDVNIHMRKILPLLLCKQLYDEQKARNDETSYLNIIVDEAHNILSRNSDRESEQWKDYRLETFEEIIKEGRKFGVFLTIASQRPSDISATIISQLHNYFLHRLINNNDILAVEKTISYLDKLSFEYLPILPTGTCILAGLAAQVPVVIDIGKIEDKYEPNNKTRGLIKNWV